MMVFIGRCISVLVAVVAFGTGAGADDSLDGALRWLGSRQAPAGAIGGAQAGLAETAVAAVALHAAGERGSAYYRALTYLENQAGGNVDFESRRILALAPHGANIDGLRAFLADAAWAGGSGTAGWGLSGQYVPSALDSALALSAYRSLGVGDDIDGVIAFLSSVKRNNGLSDSGWALGLEDRSNPIVTAMVLTAISPFEPGPLSLAPIIDSAAATLASLVGDGSDPLEIAAGVRALAVSGRQAARRQSLAAALRTMQRPNGSWADDVLTTALAVEALIAADGGRTEDRFVRVGIPDAALRRAINRQLGRNAMDALNRDELTRLAELDARGLGIADLTGLEWAVNLRSADLRDNAIESRTPMDGLSGLQSIQLAGNPVALPLVAATLSWQPGLTLVAYLHRVAAEHATCKGLLAALGDSGAVLMRLDPVRNRFLACTATGGEDFAIGGAQAYYLRAERAAWHAFEGRAACQAVALAPGLNLRGYPLPRDGLTCYAWLAELGPELASAIGRLDPRTHRYQTCAFDTRHPESGPVGVDFAVRMGEGYRLSSPRGGTLTVPGCE